MKRQTLIGLVIVAVVGALLASLSFKQNQDLPESLRGVAVNPPQLLQRVNLIDHNKQAVTVERFKNGWTFLFIGFTSCTHICVPALSQMVLYKKAILKQQPAMGEALAFVFVSVDPERDTPEHLAKYLLNFDPEFVGMTGDEAAVVDLEKQIKAFHRVREDKKKPQGYDIDHSGEVYLIDPAGRLTAKFLPPLDPNEVAAQFNLFVSYFAQNRPES